MSRPIDSVLQALSSHGCRRVGKTWACPAHDDKSPSLSVTEAADGRVLLHCHAGCSTERVLAALGLALADLHPESTQPHGTRIIATYDYVDEEGSLLFQVCRLLPKGFRQRRPDGKGGWIWNLNGTHRVLFRLARVLEAAKAGGTVYVVEGEKDVIAIEQAGGVATCNPGGAGKWREEYSAYLVGARCRVVADNDPPGRQHALAVAASLRSSGVDVEILLPAHGKDAADHLAHGLSLEDFAPLRDDAAGDSQPADDFHLSDTGNGRLFAAMFGDDVRFDFRRNRWLVWSGHRWARDADGELVRMAEAVARRRYETAWTMSDKVDARRHAAFALSSENRIRIAAMLDLARSQHPIADGGEGWDADPMLLGVPNGVVDLRTGFLRDGNRGDRLSLHAGVSFEREAPCGRWLCFLDEVFGGDAALVEYVWRAVGYSITGVVSEQCLFLLFGVGANGKSTFLNAIRRVAGDYGYNMPFSTVEMEGRASVPNDLAALVDRRLVTSSETNETVRLNEGRVKALTGGDPITARFLHQEFFTFRPVAKFWLGVNHKPRVGDDSHGFWRRVRMIPFRRQFPGDKTLEAELAAESPGILRWAVEGCLRWQERGLDPPDCVQDATEEYRRESDLIEEFIEECIEPAEETELPVRDIVAAYEQWANREGLKPRERLGSRALRSRLKERWPERHRPAVRSTPARYLGLSLRAGDA